MKITFDSPAIVADTGAGPYWLVFESPPNVTPGETYRTFYPGSSHADHGSFLALWVDGDSLFVKALDGWTPTKGHVVLP